jgi:hypothetical protein
MKVLVKFDETRNDGRATSELVEMVRAVAVTAATRSLGEGEGK